MLYEVITLILAVVQDQTSREVLMCAYMNREALEKTVETGIAHFWSRSRKRNNFV